MPRTPCPRTRKPVARLALAAAVVAPLAAAGCNTVHGIGRDMQAVGREIEKAAASQLNHPAPNAAYAPPPRDPYRYADAGY